MRRKLLPACDLGRARAGPHFVRRRSRAVRIRHQYRAAIALPAGNMLPSQRLERIEGSGRDGRLTDLILDWGLRSGDL